MPVMDVASGAFYTSGTFWAGAGTVAGIAGTAAVVWVTLSVGLPRRRMFYWLRASVPLLAAPEGMRSDLELRRRLKAPGGSPDAGDGWGVLADPRVVTIDLTSRGRRDIPSDAYDKNQPLQLDAGAPVVEVLQVTSSVAARPAPPVTADGTLLSIGPGLIGKRQDITITILTDGGQPALILHADPFIDVRVRAAEASRIPDLVGAAVVVAGLAGAVVVAEAGTSLVSVVVAVVVTVVVTMPAARLSISRQLRR
jgi:hypothetical protein